MQNHLKRFYDAQKRDYHTALAEIRSGRKRSHWMWYIFPQIHDLGYSSISQYYAIQNLQEAREYLKDRTLGDHLEEISTALLQLRTNDPHEVFGSPDDLKLCSCMTLFEKADPKNQVFAQVLDKFYDRKRDQRTLEILRNEAPEALGDRQIYNTPIGPVCMSKTEHDAYIEELEMRKDLIKEDEF
ncbi:MAG: DUF1810 domain-containing protein [Eubacterium sp.]|nr:DUF1810 domain-containing protein [Eubacterium sp.]